MAETEPTEIAPVLDICLSDPDIGGAVLAGHFGGYHTIGGDAVLPFEKEAAESLVGSMRARGKPLLVHSVHGRHDLPPLARLRAGGVPVTDSIAVLAAVARGLSAAAWKPAASPPNNPAAVDENELSSLLAKAAAGPPRWLMEPEARDLLRRFDVDVPDFATVTGRKECAAAVEAFGAPVALKRIAPDSVHKSHHGGVALNVPDSETAETVFERLMAQEPNDARVLVTPMIAAGIEIVIGGVRDRQFGPVVMLGLGGVGVEALDDVTFRPAPIARGEAIEMFGELRSKRLFIAEAGAFLPGLEAAADLLAQISSLLAMRPEIAEIDLNPVFLRETGPAIADARIVLT